MAEPNVVRQPQGFSNRKTRVEFAPDTFPPSLFSIQVTLNSTPGNVTRIEIPELACGFRLHPTSGNVRFAVDKDPQQQATSSASEISVSDLADGHTARQDFWEVRTFETNSPNRGKELRLTGVVGSEVLDVEFF